MKTLEDFTLFPVCTKCDNRDEDKFTIRYCTGQMLRQSHFCSSITAEHLHVECDRCKFEHYMQCADAEEQQLPSQDNTEQLNVN